MGGLDLMVISAGAFLDVDEQNPFEADKKIIEVDILGFWAMAQLAVAYFEKQKTGHLVGFSSIDALRGNASCPAYSGAKAFVSTYLEGVRNKMKQSRLPIHVTEIIPGFVDNEKIAFSKMDDTYWAAPLPKATKQIFTAIKNKKERAYVTKRWRIIAWLLAITPEKIYNKIGGF